MTLWIVWWWKNIFSNSNFSVAAAQIHSQLTERIILSPQKHVVRALSVQMQFYAFYCPIVTSQVAARSRELVWRSKAMKIAHKEKNNQQNVWDQNDQDHTEEKTKSTKLKHSWIWRPCEGASCVKKKNSKAEKETTWRQFKVHLKTSPRGEENCAFES